GGLARSTGAFQYSMLNMEGLLQPWLSQRLARSLNMRDLGRDLCSTALSPQIRSLLIYNSNPAVSLPNQQLVRAGLEREDLFTVVHDLFVTETAKLADLVLPATSQLEHLDLVPSWGHHYVSLNQPAIEPSGESVSNTELFRRLARSLNRDEPCLYESDEELLRTALQTDHPMMRGITFDRLRQCGWLHLNHEEDWRPFAAGGFPTSSGRAELWSGKLQSVGLDPLPSAGEIRRGAPGTLQLISGKTLHFLNTGYSHQEPHRRREGVLQIEMHRDDLESRGLCDGEYVRVCSSLGEIVAVCRSSRSVQRGVVWMPFGGLQDALGVSRHVNNLTPEEPTDWGGGSGFYDTFVEVLRATAIVSE
ncbi:MAG: molybdopterin-dependent oxidoreductase, partial [Planctomycetaceae bacterium]